MNDDTLLLRQVHPQFLKDDQLTSQAFFPFPKDNGRLSVYDGDQISAEASYRHYTEALGFQSQGVWAVSGAESAGVGLAHVPDPLTESPAHAVIDFGQRPEKECRKLAKRLRDHAVQRGCLHAAGDAA
ncbi:MAG: hypothetical protein IT479_01085 [Xanthomonadales bacterium]|jgi:hypothetical protein|nr:hypothetical protein [Xanthomonadales bacterium]MCC6591843.1 hypothetical protein [Xanthomonadales bacterium]MCE7931981.1 hypothetical protein [Xanthomonadales bacterium PRO6]